MQQPKPTDDFFHYVNGAWLAANPIPADEAQWGSFYTLRFDVEKQIRTVLDEVSAKENVAPDSGEQKIRDFYKSATDVSMRNRLGITPLDAIFKKIDAIGGVDAGMGAGRKTADVKDISRVVGGLHRQGIGAFWTAYVGQDEKQSDLMALQFWQGGLNLPDRDYYLNDDARSRNIRWQYLIYMSDMLLKAGMAKDPAAATPLSISIMDLETRLAKASLSRVELRDVEKMYNKMTLAAFSAIAPNISLADYFSTIAPAQPYFAQNTAGQAYMIVGQPKFFEEVSKIFAETPLETIKLYLRWCALNNASNYLSEEFEQRNFDFYAATFAGVKEMKPLWRRALRATDAAMEELLGKLYVEKYFSEDAKAKIKDLVEHLVVAYRARLEKLDWMGGETKKKAFEKLAAVSRKLGYPDVWKDYTALTIAPDAFFENATRAATVEFDRKIKEVGGPVNRGEWLMSPQTVNAYYMPPMNEIAFPAAILQPPFFDGTATGDFAANYGGVGTFIGHELTHGFDDQGSRFDAKGNLNEWWTPEDKARFDAKAAHLAGQFDKYELFPGAFVNGKLTLGENIADLGGLVVAYDAMKLAIAENPALAAPIDGETPEQRFFIACAITERGHYREERARLLLQTDPHSPAQFRINGPLSNSTEFYEAFGAKEGDKLWRTPEDRVKIW